jgi:TorA maturation chaperone TorD
MDGEVDAIFEDLDDEYERLFSYLHGENVSLVESFYKPWTQDRHCPLPFSTARGLLMGDSALHLSEVYGQWGLELPVEFKSCPDHLVLEMELLSYLYKWAAEAEIRMFIEDHLDWIPLLGEELRRVDPHPFYVSAFEVLDLFIKMERERLEVGRSETKIFH